MAYINNMVTPYKFAVYVYDNTTDAYYIVKARKSKGIKTARCIILLLTNGNKLNIVNSSLSKKSLEQYNQVWDYIINKNNNILVGYTDINKKNIKKV